MTNFTNEALQMVDEFEFHARTGAERTEARALVQKLEDEADPGLEGARLRLAALDGAVDRNRRQPINDENFEKFFGYPGFAQRNT